MPFKTFSGRPLSQRSDELAAFIELLKDAGCRSYLEVGTRHGDTFYHVMRALPAGSRGVALDLPNAKWGRADSDVTLRKVAADLRSHGYEIELVFGPSGTLATRQNVMTRGPFDAVFIDGDHTYEGVRADWENYGRMGRIVAFHDIDGHGVKSGGGLEVEVPRLWAEIKAAGHDCREIIGRKRGMGIGVVLRGKEKA